MLLLDKFSIVSFTVLTYTKNSGSYGDFDLFCLIVGHREVKNSCKAHFQTEMYEQNMST